MQSRSSSSSPRRLTRWLKRGLIGLVAAVGVVGIVSSLMPKPVPVDLATAARGPLTVTVDEDGQARVKDRYVVSAPIGGRVGRIDWDPGREVRAGEIIATIVPNVAPLLDTRARASAEARVAAARATKRQAAAQITQAEAALDFAQAEQRRIERLAQDNIGTERDREEVRMTMRTSAARLDSARFALKVAEHEERMAEAALGRFSRKRGRDDSLVIAAPVGGRVLNVLREDAGVVRAGTPLVELGDPAALEIVVDVFTRDAVRITVGAAATIDRWGGPPLRARVRRIDPSAFTRLSALGVEEQRVNVILDLTDDRTRWTALGDGYHVEARIAVSHDDRALTVPTSAAFRAGQAWAVYKVVDDVVQQAPVDIGRRTGRRVQILDGLIEGDTVVVHPSDRIRAGVKVTERR